MRTCCLLAGLLLIGASLQGDSLRADPPAKEPDPRAILEKAIEARGGLAALQKLTATRTRYRRKKDDSLGESWVQSQEGVHKYRESNSEVVALANGRKAWLKAGGEGEGGFLELPEEFMKQIERIFYLHRLTNLAPLLDGKVYKLSGLEEIQKGGAAVVGIQVTAKGRPDVNLYFDKNTGLLVKASLDIRLAGKQSPYQVHFSDYEIIGWTEEALLKNAKRGVKGPDLIDALRRGIPAPARREELEALVYQLGDKSYAVRERASAALVNEGLGAAGILRRTAGSADLERARRIEKCLHKLAGEIDLAAATVRLIGFRKPAGAVEALLDFLPFAPTESLAREVEDALVGVAAWQKPSPALLRALKSDHVRVRKAATAALGKDPDFFKQPGRRVYPTGLRSPRRMQIFLDGQKTDESEVLSAECFNRFEDSVFEPPMNKTLKRD